MVETLLYLACTNAVRNLKVFALVRNREKAEKRFAHLLHDARLQFIVQDVCFPVQSFLYFSSGAVYGKVDERLTEISETDYGYLNPMDVRSCYGESKRMGETICVSYRQQFGLPVKVVCPEHTYGPGMDLNDARVFADFVKNIVNGEDIVMYSDGSASRAFCYLSDATVAFSKTLLNGKAGEAYNVANPSCEVTIREFAEKLVTLRLLTNRLPIAGLKV